jgi:hypothetical protein
MSFEFRSTTLMRRIDGIADNDHHRSRGEFAYSPAMECIGNNDRHR